VDGRAWVEGGAIEEVIDEWEAIHREITIICLLATCIIAQLM